jgi:parallel beta-helix repeat protein
MFVFAFGIHLVEADPKIWHVDDDGGADFVKIQDAIEAASPGDVIYVHSGMYSENVDVHKSLELVGEDITTTVVDGRNAGCVIRVAADYVNISGFTVQNSGTGGISEGTGIFLDYSHGCTIRGNILQYNERDIWVWNSEDCTISGNFLQFSSEGYTLYVWGPNNTITDNMIYERGVGIVDSGGNILRNNAMSQFSISGYSLDHYISDVDTSNTVRGKPIYYWISQQDKKVPLNAGAVVIVNSTNIVARDLNLVNVGDGLVFAYTNDSVITNITSQRASYGVRLDFCSNNTLKDTSLSENMIGIFFSHSNNNSVFSNIAEKNSWAGMYLGESSENRIYNNTLQNNEETGISLEGSSNNTICENAIVHNGFGGDYPAGASLSNSVGNLFYQNNFIDNKVQVSVYPGEANSWDDGYPSGGNYWSDLNATDLFSGPFQNESGSDGIGDSPYVIGEFNSDRYPLMQLYVSIPGDLNLDGIVDISDAILVASAFGSYPGHSNWYPQADLNQDNIIDIFDIIMLASNFGKH